MPFVLLAVMFLSPQAFLAAPAADQLSKEQVLEAQRALKAEGFDPGPLDGIVGPLTTRAVRRFQESNKMRVTGRLDQPTRDRLTEKLAKRAPSAPANLRLIEVGVE